MLIRPINVVFLPLLFFLPSEDKFSLKKLASQYFSLKNIIIAIISFVIVFTPQVIYWKFAYGEYFPDTYPNEKFTNLLSPKFTELFFAAKSGLFLYSPAYLLFFITLIVLIIRTKQLYFIISLLIFIVVSYLTAAWYEYFFGCGFGNRNYVEYSVLLVYPIAFVFHSFNGKKILLSLYSVLILACAFVNIKLTESFDMCFFGKDIWDYHEYKYLLFNHTVNEEINYDTNVKYTKNTKISKDPYNEENTCSLVEPSEEFGSTISIPVKSLGYITPRKVEFSVDVFPLDRNFQSEIAVQVIRNNKQVYFQALPFATIDPTFQTLDFFVQLPKDLTTEDEIVFFFWNRGKNQFMVDNYKFKFK